MYGTASGDRVLTARSMDSVDVVRSLTRVHQRIHSRQTGTSAAGHTPEGISHASEGGQIGDKANIEPAGTSHVEGSRKMRSLDDAKRINSKGVNK